MTREQRVLKLSYLINCLQKEMPEYSGYQIPSDPEDAFNLFRALCNVRMPQGPTGHTLPEEFYEVQAEVLQEITREKGITPVFADTQSSSGNGGNAADSQAAETVDGFENDEEVWKEPRWDAPASNRSIHMKISGENGRQTSENLPGRISPSGLDPRLALWQGDITTLKADAIVNAANSQMLGCFSPLHGCIDNIIHTMAGVELREECYRYMREQIRRYGRDYEETTGRAMITKGYNLPAEHVIHTVGPIVTGPLTHQHRELLASCYTSCLDLASENNLKSIAFCCISTGVFMFPQDKAADIAVRTVQSWLDQHPDTSIRRVVFNVFKDRDREIYTQLLDR